ncbi:MAG: hypothetical protein VKL41_19030 [Snowella sp.]|nr:hypothetical protein [Snowella sp.]
MAKKKTSDRLLLIKKCDRFPRNQGNELCSSRSKRQKLPIIRKQLLIDAFFSRWIARQ